MGLLLLFLCMYITIFIHEGAHYIAAKIYSVKTEEFCIGIGPKILNLKGRNTTCIFKPFPFGGYCKFNSTFNRLPLKKRLAIGLSGISVNFLVAFTSFGYITSWRFITAIKALVSNSTSTFDFSTYSFSSDESLAAILSFPVDIYMFVVMLCGMNLLFMLFNLLPIPTLDGGNAILDIILIVLKRLKVDQRRIVSFRQHAMRLGSIIVILLFFVIPLALDIADTYHYSRLAIVLITISIFFSISLLSDSIINKYFIKKGT